MKFQTTKSFMRYILIFSVLLLSTTAIVAQDQVNLKGGYAAEGYDVVAYFQNDVQKGNKEISATHEGVNYKFHSVENLETFQKNPAMYVPQYGGFCAYAVAKNGEKVGVNPKTYTISDGKLYLFYNSWGVNTLEKWNEEGAETLQKKADVQWQQILKAL